MTGAKKWSKTRTREKAEHMVLFDQKVWDKMEKEIPKMKVITPAQVCERLKINLTLSRRCIEHMVEKGVIKPVVTHNSLCIYTRATTAEA